MLKKQESITSENLDSGDFWQIVNGILNKGKSAIPSLFKDPELSSASNKAKLFAESFLHTLILMTQISLYLFSRLEIIWNLHNISVFPNMVKKVIINLDLSEMSSHYYIPLLVLKNFLTYQLNSWISVWKSLVFHIVGRFHWWSPHLKILENGVQLKTATLLIVFLWLVKSLANL